MRNEQCWWSLIHQSCSATAAPWRLNLYWWFHFQLRRHHVTSSSTLLQQCWRKHDAWMVKRVGSAYSGRYRNLKVGMMRRAQLNSYYFWEKATPTVREYYACLYLFDAWFTTQCEYWWRTYWEKVVTVMRIGSGHFLKKVIDFQVHTDWHPKKIYGPIFF